MRELTMELFGPPPTATAAEVEYFSGNYQTQLKPGMGVEMVYELLGRVGRSSHWVDLGAGPFSALWGLGLPSVVERLTAVDRSPLNLWMNDHHWHDLLDGPYARSLIDTGIVSHAARKQMRGLRRRYLVGDAFRPAATYLQTDEPPRDADVITAIGLLGLARDEVEVTSALRLVHNAARPGAWFVGASWLRREAATPAFARDWPDGLSEVGEAAGMHIEDIRHVELAGDDEFDTVLGWTMIVPDEGR